MFSRPLMLAATIAAGLGIAGCGKDAPTDPLAFAPANTPYLLANTEPVPAAAIDTWMKSAEQMMPLYEKMLDDMSKSFAKEDPNALPARIFKALRDEFKGKVNRAGMESIGWSMSSRSAVYGIGLIPVMRMELGDPEAFKAFIGRIETKVGEKLTTGKVDKQDYWFVATPDGKLRAVMALQGKHLVLTVAPKAADDAVMKQLLGLELPSESALDAKILVQFNKDRGYLPYGSGFADTEKLLTLAFGERSPTEQAFLDALETKDGDTAVSPVCKAEAKSIAANVPRLSFGYTALEAKRMDLRYVMETSPAIGAELSKLAVIVPGLDGAGEGLFDFGFGLDLNALVSFVNARSSAVASAPYQCESLKPLNEMFAEARKGVSNPGIYMVAAAAKGINVSLSKFEMPEGAPPVVEGRIALASDNPQSLLAMAGNFAPQIASLSLQPNQAPIAMPIETLPPGTPVTYAALSDKAIGFAIGEGQQATLQEFISSKATQASPLLHYGLNGKGMATFFDLVIKQAETALVAAEAMQAMPSDNESEEAYVSEDGSSGELQTEMAPEQSIEEQRAALDMMKGARDMYVKSIERGDFAVYASSRGIEMGYVLEMK